MHISNSLSFRFEVLVLFVDDFSYHTWVFPMKNKSEVSNHFHVLYIHIERLCIARVRYIQSVGGVEFVSNQFGTYLSFASITHQKPCPHTLSQNSLVERNIRHLVEKMRTFLIHAHIPPQFWFEALLTTTYIHHESSPCVGIELLNLVKMLVQINPRQHLHARLRLPLSSHQYDKSCQ